MRCTESGVHADGHAQVNRLFAGGAGRNRTADASLFRAALYRLSYRPIFGFTSRGVEVAFIE